MIKLSSSLLSIVLLCALLPGCKKDNYDKPSSVLSGKVVYNKEPIGVRSNGVQLELWQHGFELFSKIPVYVAQDGSFSASLFDGHYKLVKLQGNGPWTNNGDSIDIEVNGNTVVEVPVEPYFIIKNTTIVKGGTIVTATFSIEKISTLQALESVSLYAGKTNIVDQVSNLGAVTVNAGAIGDITAPITIQLTIPAALAAEPFFFARVAVKTTGVAERIYTQPIKIE